VTVWPDAHRGVFTVELHIHAGGSFTGRLSAWADADAAGQADFRGRGSSCVRVELPINNPRLWSPADPHLYRIDVRLDADGARDQVSTWGGLRKIQCDGTRVLLNDQSVFLRTVLDQGFYPDGIYTAPSEAALEADIRASQAFGFNGARLHEKVFEPVFLHMCDRLGYLVFGEYADWGRNFADPRFTHDMLDQWTEALQRDMSHPSIIGWCPLNETAEADRTPFGEWTVRRLYRLTKTLDPTRPALDTSGYWHYETDIWDTHNYNQDVDSFAAAFKPLTGPDPSAAHSVLAKQLPYDGRRPYFVSEYGGIRWQLGAGTENGWGYGQAPATEAEFLSRFRGLTEALLFNPGVAGLCYTQLTDVEQEINGLLTYQREPKFPAEAIAEVLRQKAAIEA
jgi:beta-galactosidase/beta-glucuronidase